MLYKESLIQAHYGLLKEEIDVLLNLNDAYGFTWEDMIKVIMKLPKTYQSGTPTITRLKDFIKWTYYVQSLRPTKYKWSGSDFVLPLENFLHSTRATIAIHILTLENEKNNNHEL